ncbi:putative tetratricopeptide-like helical domain superfamily [Helianthus annuus]|nr:putative tetratricopeptide-like helical domain superfamily [Helianthus annuus]
MCMEAMAGAYILTLFACRYYNEPTRCRPSSCCVVRTTNAADSTLARSSHLQEAENVIRTMPVNVKADSIIWKTLLSACRIYKNADMAKRIAEEVIRVDPHDSAS